MCAAKRKDTRCRGCRRGLLAQYAWCGSCDRSSVEVVPGRGLHQAEFRPRSESQKRQLAAYMEAKGKL